MDTQTHTCLVSSALKDAAPNNLSRSPRRRLWPQYPAYWKTSCDHRNSPREPAPRAGLTGQVSGRWKLPWGRQHPQHPQEAPSAFFLLSGPWSSSRPLGHEADASCWERQRHEHAWGPGVGLHPSPSTPHPGPVLLSVGFSHPTGRAGGGVAPGGGTPTWPLAQGLPTHKGNPLRFAWMGVLLSS